ncbi:thiamine pyrophosphate-dependent enzyme [Nocardia sp. NPDC051570]|uniref:thiamine pyrophosphate-dependent enzyme n=1 Tax=Nocardia sp. NPDC051570 TaxID=3364324 RepID=UPI003795CFEB
MINEREAELDRRFREAVRAASAGPRRAATEPVRTGSPYTGVTCLELFDAQAASRHLDLAARRLTAAGRGYYSIGSSGHEGNVVLAAALRATDPALLHYRSGAFFVHRCRQVPGLDPIRDVLLGVVAAAADPISGGRHKVFGSHPASVIPQTSTIASHLPRAVGLGFALDRATRLGLRGEWPSDAVVLCTFGDASANHSTAAGAINAAIHTAYQQVPMPVLFVCEDNGIGISVPTPGDWIEQAYGSRPGLRYFTADGADPLEALAVSAEAARWVRENRRPAFLRLRTVRLLGHAGSDVESAYRRSTDITAELTRDPVAATARLLVTAGVATAEQILQRYDSIAAQVTETAARVSDEPKLTTTAEVIATLAPAHPRAVREDALRVEPLAAIDGPVSAGDSGFGAAGRSGSAYERTRRVEPIAATEGPTPADDNSFGAAGRSGSVHERTRSVEPTAATDDPIPADDNEFSAAGRPGSPQETSIKEGRNSFGERVVRAGGSVAAAGSSAAPVGGSAAGIQDMGARSNSAAAEESSDVSGRTAAASGGGGSSTANGSARQADSPGRGAMTLAQSVNHTLAALLERDGDLLVFGEDVGRKGGVYGVTKGLQKTFGRRRVFDTLLDEQSVLGTALGAGLAGFVPIPEIQYLAYVHNALDQIRGEAATLQFFSAGRYRNPMVVRIAGYAYQKGFGGHFHNDDSIAALRDIPGVVVASPARADDAAAMLRICVSAARIDGRVCVYLEPIALYHTRDLYESGDDGWLAPASADPVDIGRARIYGDGTDLTIVTFANGVRMSLRAARRLAERGIAARVLDLRWLSPLPLDDLLDQARATGRVLIADETRRSGGVSESVCAALLDGGFTGPIARVTSVDSFVPLGPATAAVLLDEQTIEAAAEKLAGVPTARHDERTDVRF